MNRLAFFDDEAAASGTPCRPQRGDKAQGVRVGDELAGVDQGSICACL